MSFFATGYLEPTYLLNRANHTGTQTASTISDFAESVDDRVAALLVAGSNVTLTYDDVANTLTIASAGGGGGSGTVTSVALSLPSIFSVSGSPVTTSGTLTATLASQTQNLVFASPNGSSGTPTFRALASADIPDLSAVYQPLDSDLTSIAALTTTSFGRSLLTQSNAAATRSTVGAFNVAGDTLTGTAGAGFVGIPVQSSNPSAPASGVRVFANSSGVFSWINTGGIVRSLGGSVTADRLYTLPDASGTVALTSDLSSYLPIAGGSLTGTAGAGFIGLPTQSSNPSAPGSGFRLFANSSGVFSWTTSSGFIRTLASTLTADRTYTLPDASGTVALTATTFNLTGDTLTGTAGAGFVGLPVQSSNPSTPGAGVRVFANSSGVFSWIGTSGFVRSLGGTVTADRTYTLPDSTGTIALTTLISGATAGVTFNDQTISRYGVSSTSSASTTYSLTSADNGRQITFTSSSAVTVTVPTGLPSRFNVILRQKGTGKVTVTNAVGVTLVNADGQYATAKQYAAIALMPDPDVTDGYFVDGYTTT